MSAAENRIAVQVQKSPRARDPREDQIRRLVKQLKVLGVDVKHERHQMIVNSVRKVKVEDSGIAIH